MKITIVTLFPDMLKGFFDESIIKRAQDKKLVEVEVVNLRDFSDDSYKTVDDKPYGGGAGMILKVDVLNKAIEKVTSSMLQATRVILTSAKGKQFNQENAQEFSKLDNLVIIAGHYEGVDERIMDEIDEEVSLGDFVMTGGEVTAAAVVDSVVRLIPGVLKKDEATVIESFQEYSVNYLTEVIGKHEVLEKLQAAGVENVRLLEYPHYTRPEEFEGKKVPEILLSGNHAEIEKWRVKQSFEQTLTKRPDLLDLP
ncbi:MAG: tRNA (guanosine(37)-N1)-methyltransferase TrmD [Patescibacteria group bacterium]